MNNQKRVFIAIVSVVFIFASYNLFSHFQEQTAEKERQEQIALEQQREAEEAQRLKALEEERKRIERERLEQEFLAKQAAEAKLKEQARLAAA